MPNIILDRAPVQLESRNIFDFGIVDEVVKKPISLISDEKIRVYHLEAFNEPLNLYNVEITTGGYLREIPVLYPKNFIYPPKKGDQVLVSYLSKDKFPFIFWPVTYDYRGARKSMRLSFPIDDDEIYLTANKANFIHIRKDGALVIRGADVFEEESMSNSYFIIGGDQGKSKRTGNRIIMSMGVDQTGPIIQVDSEGNTILDAQDTMFQVAQTLRQFFGDSLKTLVGVETESDDTRKGLKDVWVGKQLIYYVGEELIIQVGDTTKDDNRKQATADVNVSKKLSVHAGGKDPGNLFLDENGFRIGADDAKQPLVLGWKLANWLQTHTHVSTSPGQPTSPPTQTSTIKEIYSKHHKIKD